MFQNEAQLQHWIAAQLRSAGYRPELEVITDARHKTRADIVCNGVVIECKKVLDRDSLHQAASQAAMYAIHLGLSKKILVGMPPFSSEAQKSADSAAAAIMSADENLAIYWVNQSGFIPIGLKRAGFLKLGGKPAAAPVAPVAIPAPVAPAAARGIFKKPSRVPTWQYIAMIFYIALGAYLMGGIGSVIGLIAGIGLMITW